MERKIITLKEEDKEQLDKPKLYLLYNQVWLPKCHRVIEKGIANKEEYVQIYMKWFCELNLPFERKECDRIYQELQEHYWNVHSIQLYFGGNNSGTAVSIYYMNDPEKLEEIQQKHENLLFLLETSLKEQKKNLLPGTLRQVEFENVRVSARDWSFILYLVQQKVPSIKIVKQHGFFFMFKL